MQIVSLDFVMQSEKNPLGCKRNQHLSPSTERADAPDATGTQSGVSGDDVHDHVPLSALADIVRLPGGARSVSKGGCNFSTTHGRTSSHSPLHSRVKAQEQRPL